jgi:hypothetical protein
MLTLYLLQSVLPLVLIAWLCFAPPCNVAGFWIQALAIGVVLVAISRAGIMSFPPWWMLYIFGALLVVAVASGVVRRRGMTRWPSRLAGWLCLAGFAIIGVYAANITRVALAAAATPKGRIVDLATPLAPGTYRHRNYWGTGHGVDLIALNRWGLRSDGLTPTDPQRYVIFGRPVIAPCAGQIIVAIDGLPDMQVPKVDRAHLAGNHVILRCGDVDILLGHFRKGSVRVRVGQALETGDAIAQVGNSGNTSEPHLHINAQLPGTATSPFGGAPIPIRIERRYLVRNDRIVAQ